MSDEAVAAEATPKLEKAAAAPALVRLSTHPMVTLEFPETDLPTVTSEGVDVTRDQADQILTIAMKMDVPIREGV